MAKSASTKPANTMKYPAYMAIVFHGWKTFGIESWFRQQIAELLPLALGEPPT